MANPATPDGFGLSNLRKAQETPRPRQQTLDIRLSHPAEAQIVAICDAVANGSETDIAGKMREAIALLTTDGIYVRFSTTTVEDNKTIPFTLADGSPAVNLGSFAIWAAKPSDNPEENVGRMLYKSWGRTVVDTDGKTRVVGKGFVRALVEEANARLRRLLGWTPAAKAAPAAAPAVSIPEGRKAPVTASGGDTEVDPGANIPF